MIGTFLAALALLAVMLYLVIRPFLWAPRAVSSEDVAHEAILLPEATPVYAAMAAESEAVNEDDASATSSAPDTTPATTALPPVESGDDVRARVEALIAARKAELSAPKCSGCSAVVTPDDAFCRSCGTKLH
jgi:hypothetical protein